ncbi:MAG: hypothetical protein RAM36_01510 [Arsenophonus sp.]|nr:hypothetical protein [Arsenophonus sp.]
MRNTIKTIGKNVKITQSDEQGKVEKIIIPIADIPNRVNEGEWDDNPSLALLLINEYWKKGNFNNADLILSYRCVIAVVFLLHCVMTNGQAYYTHRNYHLPVYLMTERMGMANNIEGAFYERESKSVAEKHILTFYQNMLEGSDKGLKLSSMGQKTLSELHDIFIDDVLNEYVKPVTVH